MKNKILFHGESFIGDLQILGVTKFKNNLKGCPFSATRLATPN
jgi:hypothetical protein